MSTQAPAIPAAAPAHDAAHHWGLERMLSVGTLLLFVWFFVSLWRLPGLDLQTVSEWLKHPLAAGPMLLLIVTAFLHLKHGLVVVVEDYVHTVGGRFAWVFVINALSLAGGTLALLAVLKLAVAASA
ncbi:MAG: succinate dehydrogenase, hydrophobic membrane anchor protein [Sphingomonadaceae bacterium]|nr:succinate dehydrogenase, hydrophobic membrane anchor protein [Sphingomonadaceae bacterium]